MNKYILVIVVFLLLFSGCKRDRADYDEWDRSQTMNRNESRFYPTGFAAVQNSPFYDLSSSDNVQWKGAFNFGDILELDDQEIRGRITPGRQVVFRPRSVEIDGETVQLIPVVFGEQRGWITAGHYAGEGFEIGVVVRQPIDFGDRNILNIGDIVIFSDNSRRILFTPFLGRIISQPVEQGLISFNFDDIEAAKLLLSARTTRNQERSRALLSEIIQQYPNSAVVPVVNSILNPFNDARGRETEWLVALFSVSQDRAPVYSEPSLDSPLVTHFEQYADVKTTVRTVSQFRTSLGFGHWYHINLPVQGWVFARYLEGAD